MGLFNDDAGNIHINFYRVGEDYKTLKNEKYELYTIDGKSTGITLDKNKDGKERLDLWFSVRPGLIDSFVPSFIKENVSTNDINDIKDWLDEEGQEYSVNGGRLYFHVDLPVILKHITAEIGYKKSDLIVDCDFSLYIYFNESTGEVINRKVYYYDKGGIDPEFNYFFDTNYNPQTKEYESFKYSVNSLRELNELNGYYQSEDFACVNTNSGMIITDRDECTVSDNVGSSSYLLLPYFMAEKGEVKFNIENTVNGLAKYNASKDKKLEYKITFKNIGNASSSNNIINTYIPKELTIDAKSISDNGVYNKDSNTITWNVDLIDVGEVLSVTYEATAPEGTNGKELIGHSTIKSDQVKTAVLSNETIVTMDKIVEIIDNPDTGTMLYIANTNIGISLGYLIMLLIVLGVVIVFLIKKLRKTL